MSVGVGTPWPKTLCDGLGAAAQRTPCEHVEKDSTVLRKSGEGSDADEFSRPDHLREHVHRH